VLVEHRTYQAVVGRFHQFVELYRSEGLPIQIPIQGKLLGFYETEVGPQYQAILLWAYDSFEDRLRRREELHRDLAWLAFISKVAPLISSVESRLLRPINGLTPPIG
jgi:hypothetical protein